MGFVIALRNVMRIVGGKQRSSDGFRDRHQVRQDSALSFNSVIRNLEEEVTFAENVLIHRRGLQRLVVVSELSLVALFFRCVRGQELRHVPAKTAGGGNDALGELGEQLFIHSGLVVVALEITPRDEFHEVVVALLCLGHERHVVSNVVAPARAFEPAARRHVCLNSDNGFHARFGGGLVEIDNSVHHAVIGHRYRRLAIIGHGADDIGDAGRAVEHREFRVQV